MKPHYKYIRILRPACRMTTNITGLMVEPLGDGTDRIVIHMPAWTLLVKAVPRRSTSLTREQIKQVFLKNGFVLKGPDLKDYVYEAAHALLALDRSYL